MKVEFDDENGLLVYEIDILTPSGIFEVHVNATDGRMMRIERED